MFSNIKSERVAGSQLASEETVSAGVAGTVKKSQVLHPVGIKSLEQFDESIPRIDQADAVVFIGFQKSLFREWFACRKIFGDADVMVPGFHRDNLLAEPRSLLVKI